MHDYHMWNVRFIHDHAVFSTVVDNSNMGDEFPSKHDLAYHAAWTIADELPPGTNLGRWIRKKANEIQVEMIQ